jgi:DNA invertase Pin-like site-specific DNA recombinase
VAEVTKAALDAAGVDLKYVNLDIDRTSPIGRLVDRMMSSVDQLQSEQNSVNTKWSHW